MYAPKPSGDFPGARYLFFSSREGWTMALGTWRTWLRSLSFSHRRPRSPERRQPRLRPPYVEQLEVRLSPATNIWTGAGGGGYVWSNAANWSLGRAPVAGDDLIFPAAAPDTTHSTSNDLTVDTEFNSIAIATSSGHPGYLLSGNRITLGNPGGGGNILVNALSAGEVISLDIQLGGSPINSQSFNVGLGADLTFSGRLGGTTGVRLSKDGTGTLYFTNDNTAFTGPITINQGILQITSNKALGDPNQSVTTVEGAPNNGQLQLSNLPAAVLNTVIVNGIGPKGDGALLNVAGNNTWAGSIEMDSDSTLGVAVATDTLTVSGQVSDLGAGHNLTKEGLGQLVFSHVGGNTYRGQTNINNGILTIEDPLSLGPDASGGGGTLASGTVVNKTLTETGELRVVDPSGVGFTVLDEVLTLNGFGIANAGALSNAQGNNTWAGSVILGSPSPNNAAVAIGAVPGTILTISGVVSDPNFPGESLTKVGAGELILNNANTYTGTTTVAQGILDIRDSTALGRFGGGGTSVNAGAALNLEVDTGTDAHGRNLATDSVTTLPVATIAATPNGATEAGNVVTITTTAAHGFAAGEYVTITGVSNAGYDGTFQIVTAGGTTFTYLDTLTGLGGAGGGSALVSDINGPQLGLKIATGLTLAGSGIGNTGALHSISGINVWTGGITLLGSAAIGVEPDPNQSSDNSYFTHDYSLTVTGNIGLGSLQKVDNGQLILPNANNYTGTTTIEQGWITIQNNLSLGGYILSLGDTMQPATTVFAGAALHLKPLVAGANLNVVRNFVLAGNGITHPFDLIGGKGALMALGGNDIVGGPINLGAGGIRSSDVFLNGVVGIGVELLGPATQSQLTITGKVADFGGPGGGITKFGSQRLVLQGEATYTGPVDVHEGVLRVQNDTALGRDSTGTSGGVEVFATTTTTVDPGTALELSGDVALFNGGQAAGIEINDEHLVLNSAGYTTIQTVIVTGTSGTFSLTFNGKSTPASGPGALPFNATAAQVQAALVALTTVGGVPGAFLTVLQPGGSGPYTVVFQGSLVDAAPLMSAAGSGGASVAIGVPGSLLPNQPQPEAPLTNLDSDNLWRGPVTLAQNTTIDVAANSRLSLLGSIDDGLNLGPTGSDLFKVDPGELTLGGSNSYRGVTHVGSATAFGDAIDQAGGILTVSNSLGLGSPEGGTQVSNGSMLQLEGDITIAGERLDVQGSGPGVAPANVPLRWFNAGSAPINNGETPGNEATTGRVTGVAVDPTDPKVMYVSTAGGGAWKTKNDGLTWEQLFDASPVQTLRIPGFTGGGGQITLTFNGQTTAPIQLLQPSPAILAAIIQADLNGLTSIIGTEPVPGFVTVTPSATDQQVFTITFAGALSNTHVPLITGAGLAGLGNPVIVGNPLLVPSLFCGAIAVDPNDPRIVYLGTGEADNSADSYYGTGVYVSKDSGETWAPLLNSDGSNPLFGLAVSKIAVDPGPPTATPWTPQTANSATLGTLPARAPTGRIYVATSDQAVNKPFGAFPTPGVYRFDTATTQVQTLTMPMLSGALQFDLTVTDIGGTFTAGPFFLNSPTLAADIRAGLEALPNIGLLTPRAGYVSVTQSPVNPLVFTVAFLGGLTGTNPPLMIANSGVIVTPASTWVDLTATTTTPRATLATPPLPAGPNDDFRLRFSQVGATWSDLTLAYFDDTTPPTAPPGLVFPVPVLYAALGNSGGNANNGVYRTELPQLAPITAAETAWYVGDVGTWVNEVEQLTIPIPNMGGFTLTFNGSTTGILPAAPTANQVEQALNGLSTIGGVGGCVSVVVDPASSSSSTLLDITFGCTMQHSQEPLFVVTNFNGGSASIAELTKGSGVDVRSANEFPTGNGGAAVNGNIKITSFVNPNTAGGIYPWWGTAGTPTSGVTLYAAVAYPGPGVGLAGQLLAIEESSDGGKDWAPVPTAPPNYMGVNTPTSAGMGWYASTILATSGTTVYAASQESDTSSHAGAVLETTDGGNSWTDITIGADGNGPHSGDHALAEDNTGRVVLGTDGGVWRLNAALPNPILWDDVNGTLGITLNNTVTVNPGDPTSAVGGSQGNGVEVFPGDTNWTQTDIPDGDGGRVQYDPQNPQIVYAVHVLNGNGIASQVAAVNGVLDQSLDGGKTWNTLPTTAPGLTPYAGGYFPFLVDSVNDARLLAGGASVRESLDFGTTWRNLQVSNLVSVSALAAATYQGYFRPDNGFNLVSDQGAGTYDPNTIYAYGLDVFGNPHLEVTKNRGQTWLDRLPGVTGVQAVVVDPRNRDTAYLVDNEPTGPRIYQTLNAGQSWNVITGNLPNLRTWTLVVDPRSGDLYAGNDQGVYRLPSGSGVWQQFESGMPNVAVHDLELNQALNTLTAGTYGRSMSQFFLSDASDSFNTTPFGAVRAAAGSVIWTGPVFLGSATTFVAAGTQAVPSGVSTATLNILGSIADRVPGANYPITKQGNGTILFSGANTYGGTTDIQQGVLIADNALALGSAGVAEVQTVTVTGNSGTFQLTFNGQTTGVLPFNVPASGGVGPTASLQNALNALTSVSGPGGSVAVSLSSPGVYTVTFNGSFVGFNQTAMVPSFAGGDTVAVVITTLGTGGTTVESGAELGMQSDVELEPLHLFGDGLVGTAHFTFLGSLVIDHNTGALRNLSSSNTYTGPITLETASVTIGVDSGSTLTIGQSGLLPGNGTLTGPAGDTLTKESTGTLILGDDTAPFNGGNPNLLGPVVVVQGAVRITDPLSLGSPAQGTTVEDGAQLQIQGNITVSGETLTLSGSGIVATGALLNTGGNNTWAGPIVLTSLPVYLPPQTLKSQSVYIGVTNTFDTLTIGDAAIAPAPTITEATAQLITDFGLTKVGPGKVVLNQKDTYSYLTTINQGILAIQTPGGSALGVLGDFSQGHGVIVNTGGTLQLDLSPGNPFGIPSPPSIVGESLRLNGAGAGGVGALDNYSGTNVWVQGSGLAGTITLSSSAAIGVEGPVGTTTGGSLTVTSDIDGPITSALAKVGLGTLYLPTANTYLGATQVQAGILNISNAGALGPPAGLGTTVASGATLQLMSSGTSETVVANEALTLNGNGSTGSNGALENVGGGNDGNNTWAGSVVLASDSSIGADGLTTLTISGTIGQGATNSNLTKVGTGTLLLTNNGNNYGGTTFINQGVVAITQQNSLGLTTAGTVVASGSALDVEPAVNTTFAEPLHLNGSGYNSNNTGALVNLNGNNTWTAPITLDTTSVIGDAATILPSPSGAREVGTTVMITTASPTGFTAGEKVVISGFVGAAAGYNEPLGVTIASTPTPETFTYADTATGLADSGGGFADPQTTLTLNGAIGQNLVPAGLTKEGLGTLVLGGTNTYDGTTLIDTGVAILTNPKGLGSTVGGTTVTGGAALQLQLGGATVTGEALTLNGAGFNPPHGALENLTGNNTWAGPITLASNSTIGVDPPTTLTVNGSVGETPAGSNFNLTKELAGKLILARSDSYGGVTFVTNGILNIQDPGALGGPGIAEVQTVTVTGTSGTFQLTFNGQTTGMLPFNVPASGGVGPTASLQNALNALTSVSGPGGSVAVSLSSPGVYTVTFNGSFVGFNQTAMVPSFAGGDTVAVAITTLGTGGTSVALGTALEVQLNGGTVANEPLLLVGQGFGGGNTGALRAPSGSATWTGPVTLTGVNPNVSIDADAGAVLTITGAVGEGNGSHQLSKEGVGTLVLGGIQDNTYTGLTSVDAGILQVAKPGALGTAAVGTVVQTGAELDVNASVTDGESVTLNGTGIGNAGALHNIVADHTWSGPVILTGATATIAIGADATTNLTLGSPISQSAASNLSKEGAGRVILTKPSSFTGTTTIDGGALQMAVPNALSSSSSITVNNGGSLELNFGLLNLGSQTVTGVPLSLNGPGAGGNGALRDLSGNGYQDIWTGTAPITLNTSSAIGVDANTTFTVDPATPGITGAAASTLSKVGQGTLVLDTPNTYAGPTQVQAGTLALKDPAALGPGALATTVFSGASLDLLGNGVTYNRPLFLAGPGYLGTGALIDGPGGGSNNTWAGPITLTADASVAAAGAADTLTLTGAIGESGGSHALTVVGSGSVTFSGTLSNTYTGLTTVRTGTLLLDRTGGAIAVPGDLTVGFGSITTTAVARELANSQVPDSASVNVNRDGTFDLNNNSDAVGQVTVTGGTVTTGVLPLPTGGGLTAAALTMTGGTVNATGPNSFVLVTGDANMTGGTVTALGTASFFRVNGNATMTGGTLAAAGNNSSLTVSGELTETDASVNLQGTSTSLAVGSLNMTGGAINMTGAGSQTTLNGDVTAASDLATGSAHITGGTLSLGASRTFTVNAGGAPLDLVVSAVITGATAALNKVGTGVLELTANDSYGGGTTVNGGTLDVDGAGHIGDVALINGVLGGTGTVGAINATSGTVHPGDSPGILTSTGGATFSSTVRFSVDINGPNPGNAINNYGQLQVTGPADLANSTLAVAVGNGFVPGTNGSPSFTILHSTGTLTGTFANGPTIFVNGMKFGITYDAHDVVLNRLKANTATTLIGASPGSPSTFGTPVTFVATVKPEGGASFGFPSGAVKFYDGTTFLGSAPVVNAGGIATATYTTPSDQLQGGSHSITAVYDDSSDPNFGTSSSSPPLAYTVNRSPSLTNITGETPSGSSTFGDLVTFTAQVTPTYGSTEPTGTVTFVDGTTTLAVVPLANVGGIATATFTTTTADQLTGGTHPIDAQYTPAGSDLNYLPSTSATLNYPVNRHATTTTLPTPSPASPSTFGNMVTFTAQVKPTIGGTEPTGSVTFMDGTFTLAAIPLIDVGGIATATYTTFADQLTGGAHTINATYNPAASDLNFASSTSGNLNYVVNTLATSTSIAAAPASFSVFGQVVTLTSQVTPTIGATEPTGTVNFYDGTTFLGTGGLGNVGNIATTTYTTRVDQLTGGSHTFSAVYVPGSDPNFQASTSGNLPYTVDPRTATPTITGAVPASSTFGQTVTFNVIVTPTVGAFVPSGTVTLMDGSTPLGTVPLSNVGGTATTSFTTTATQLTGGSHTITAVYTPPTGDPNFAGTSSANFTYVVAPAASTTTVTGATPPTSSTFGNAVTFTATVTSAVAGVEPTGTVTFKDGSTTLGSGTLANSGGTATATFTTTATQLTGGGHTITAVYVPGSDPNFLTSTSGNFTYTVNKTGTTTAITLVSPASPSAFGTLVTFSATVTSTVSGVEPTGSVTFKDGSTVLGSGTLANSGGTATTSYTTTAGQLLGGSHAITAVYVPGSDPNYLASASGTVGYTVAPAVSTTTVTGTTPAAPGFGEPVTLTATVTPTFGSVEPTGTVTFVDGGTPLGSGTLANSGGIATATFTTTATQLTVGNHTITAMYAHGTDTNYQDSTSATFTLTVARTKTVTVITAASPASPSTFGQAVSFTATVTPTFGTGEPTGTVTFKDGTVSLGTVNLGDVSGTATATFTTTTTQLTGGSHTITAVYLPPTGDPNFGGSTSANFTYVVNTANTTTTITGATPPTSSTFGSAVTFTATVTSAVSGFEPTGTVTFQDGGSAIGSGTLLNAGGTATATFTTTGTQLLGGNHTITAVYVPGSDPNYRPSTSGSLSYTVNRAATTATVTQASPASPAPFGTPVAFTATVTSAVAGAEPTGTVTFQDGSTVLATVNLANMAGTATAIFTTTATELAVGGHTITVVYAPGSDPDFAASTSTGFAYTINKAATTTTVTQATPASPSTFGQAVTFTATVTSAVSGVEPTGTVTFQDGSTTLGSMSLVNAAGTATATFTTTTPLTGGNHTITAVYVPGGDPDFQASTSTGFSYTVNAAATTTAITQATPAGPSPFGTAVTFTATVTPTLSGVEPTGTVAFKEGSTVLGTGTLGNSGGTATATFTTTATQLTVGGHTIVAVYAPGSDPNYQASTSTSISYTIDKAGTTTTVTQAAPASPSTFGQAVTFTVTVTPTAGGIEPTGTITFKDGTAVLVSGIALHDAGGTATATFTTAVTQLSGGNHSITAVYVPGTDPNFLGSTSTGFAYAVNPAPTKTTITQASPPAPSPFGTAVTFTATVTPTIVVTEPTGTVNFFDGTTPLGSGTLANSGGQAAAIFTTTTPLTGGSHSITAVYSPGSDPNFAGSTAAAFSYTVSPAATTTTITAASPAGPSPFGTAVTFTATVTPTVAGTEPTGTVKFFNGGTLLGSGTLADAGGKATATFTTSTTQLAVGGHTITAMYAPGSDLNFQASTSGNFSYVVGRETTTTTIVQATPAGGSTFGQQVTFVATVTPAMAGAEPTGSVTFKDGATVLGTAALQDAAGTATASLTTTAAQLTGGSHTITAVYAPGTDPNFTASTSSTFSYTVSPAATTTVVQASPPTPSAFGQAVTFSATVTPTVSGVEPTGTVTFKDGSTVLASVALTDHSGTAAASLTTTAAQLTGGSHTITAVYAPGTDPNFAASTSAGVSYAVTPAATTTTLAQATPPSPSTFGQQVTFLATVGPNVAGVEPTGTVTFKDGATVLGSTALQDLVGTATASFTTTAAQLTGGDHTITAVYAPGTDLNYQASTSADFSYTVNKAATTTAITQATPASPATFGLAVTFTATVSPAIGGIEPTGTVTFQDGTTVLGTGTLANAGGKAVASFTAAAPKLAGGSHSITAVYNPGGDVNYRASTSAGFAYLVNPAATTTTITQAAPTSPSTFGQAVTFTIQVTPTLAGVVPTGSVTVKDGTNVLGTVPLQDAGGVATAVFSTAATQLAGGTHSLNAVYNPGANPNYTGSTATPFSYTVSPAATTTTVTGATSASPGFGQPVTFTATVTPTIGNVEPTGTLTFMDGTTVLGSAMLQDAAGTATATLTTAGAQLGGGTHVITAVYAPAHTDTNFQASTSANFGYTVSPAATVVVVANATPASPGTFGQPVTFTVTVTPTVAGVEPTGTVTFKDGTTVLGTGTLADAAGTATATIATTATQLAVGNHTITALYTPGSDPNFQGGTSAGFSYDVAPAATTTVLQAMPPSPSTFGQAVTFSATVTPTISGIEPMGTVTFKDGAAILGTAALSDHSGTAIATLTTTATQLTGGTHAISAVFAPAGSGASFKGSTAAPLTYVVGQATATTTITAASPASPSFGQAVTFTATVGPALGGIEPTGSVTFKDGSIVLGTGSLTNVGGTATATVTTTAGALTVGGHTITAVYVPGTDPNYQAGPAGSLSLTVGQAATVTTVVRASPAAPTYGQAVTLTATVTPNVGSTEPTGTITFKDGAAVLVSGIALHDAGGTATATFTTTTLLGAGNHTITAVYVPGTDPNFLGSPSTGFTLSVAQVGTTTTLATTNANAVVGQAVITATVTPANTGAGAPPGGEVVDFTITNGTTTSTVSIPLAGNTATLSPPLDVGTYSIAATYHGDANFAGSSAPGALSQTVTSAQTSLTVSASPSGPVTFGQPVTFTATVMAVPPGSGTPSGTVIFNVDGTPVTRPIDGTGHATLTTVLDGGSHTVSATYGGTTDFVGSSASVPAQSTVLPAGTSTTMSVAPTSIFSGQAVTLTATVAGLPSAGAPTGTVTFFDGATPLGTVGLAGGQASLTTTTLGAGVHTLRAVYNGNVDFAASGGSATITNVGQPIVASITRVHRRPKVLVFNAADHSLRFSFFPYGKSFKGPVRVVLGDVNGDGFPDVVVAPGHGPAEPVLTFDGRTGALIGRIRIGPQALGHGVFVAAGDVNGDGKAEVLVGVGPQLRGYDGTSGALLFRLAPFGRKSSKAVRVAAVDVNGDGVDEIFAVSGSKVAGYDGRTLAPLPASEFAPFLGQILA
jgi:autotransporter-associated beta strand protein